MKYSSFSLSLRASLRASAATESMMICNQNLSNQSLVLLPTTHQLDAPLDDRRLQEADLLAQLLARRGADDLTQRVIYPSE